MPTTIAKSELFIRVSTEQDRVSRRSSRHTNHIPRASTSEIAAIGGAKKYPPPVGVTHSPAIGTRVTVSPCGTSMNRPRSSYDSCCPMTGSCPPKFGRIDEFDHRRWRTSNWFSTDAW